MAPPRAVRLFAQPIRGAILDRPVRISRVRPFFLDLPPWSRGPGSQMCPRCYSIRANSRLFSTSGRPPKDASDDATNPTSSPATSAHPQAPAAERPPTSDSELAADAFPASDLPSASEAKRSPAEATFSIFMDNLQSRVLVASQTLNDLTGYSAIDAIKAKNGVLEDDLAAAQSRLRGARQAYKTINATQAATQREVTTLLARKDTWSPSDLERFTTLYRSGHELEAQVVHAAADLTEAEAEESKLSAALTAGILRRYHEEQIWSDRIRRQSTWGTWGLMGINILLFLLFQFVAEPWRRARLIRGVAEGEKGAWDEIRNELREVKAALEARDEPALVPQPSEETATLAVVSEGGPDLVQTPWKESLLTPQSWKDGLSDLFSDRRIDLRMRDASLIALESALAGAAAAAWVVFLTVRKA